MAQNCTILCPSDEPERIAALVGTLIAGRGRVTVTGDAGDWSAITVQGSRATLILNRRVFKKPGDEFSKMRLGLWFHLDRVETRITEVKQEILNRVEMFALAVGVVAEPEFVEDAGHFDCIYGLTAALDAIIWNGSGILNADGKQLLDGSGDSDPAD